MNQVARPARVLPIASTEDELLDLVTSFTGTRTGVVTPAVAEWLLKLNTSNRSLSKIDIARFSAILERDLWVNTGEPIIVSREGILNDGQHRLTAILQTGISTVCDVRFGIERAAFVATGGARRRSTADILHIGGVENPKACAAIAKVVWHFDHGSIAQAGHPVEPAELRKLIESVPAVSAAAAILKSLNLVVLQRPWFGSAIALFIRRTDADTAHAFALAVDEGQGEPNNPARRLHERLVQEALSRAKVPTSDRLILVVKSWNAWVQHRPVNLLRVTDTDRGSQGFPPILAPPGDTP
ncbi:MAG: hypothetical protein WDN25_29970 [Acetobacteraceae bacterium]